MQTLWVVLQLGGSSGECYGTVHSAKELAIRAVQRHRAASYHAACVSFETQEALSQEQAQDVAQAMAKAAVIFQMNRFIC